MCLAKKRGDRGLSFLEVVVAIGLLFVVGSFMVGSFAMGSRSLATTKNVSKASLVAQGFMDRLLSMSPSKRKDWCERSMNGEPLAGSPPFSDYRARGTIAPFTTSTDRGQHSNLDLLELEVIPPQGRSVVYRTLISDPTIRGIASQSSNEAIGWGNSDGSFTFLHDFASEETELPPLPGSENGADNMASFELDSQASIAWAVDCLSGVLYWLDLRTYNASPDQAQWNAISPPVGGSNWEISDISVNGSSTALWVSNSARNELWAYYYDAQADSFEWAGPVRPPVEGINAQFNGISTDKTGRFVWVGDVNNRAMWRYDTLGNIWTVNPLIPPDGMNEPRGIAAVSDGWIVYVVDCGSLHRYVGNPREGITASPDPAKWARWDLPSEVLDDVPSGISVDDNDKFVWVTTQRGGVWRFFPHNASQGWQKQQ